MRQELVQSYLGHGMLPPGAGGRTWGLQRLGFSRVPQSPRVVGPGSRETRPTSAWSLDDCRRPSSLLSSPVQACGRFKLAPGLRGPRARPGDPREPGWKPGQLSPRPVRERLAPGVAWRGGVPPPPTPSSQAGQVALPQPTAAGSRPGTQASPGPCPSTLSPRAKLGLAPRVT